MHEFSIAQAVVEQATAIAEEHGARQVSRLVLAVGPLSGIVPELLQQALPLLAAGSPLEGVEVEIRTPPVRIRCQTCGGEAEVQPNRLLCADCGGWNTRVISGDELMLLSLELVAPTQVPA